MLDTIDTRPLFGDVIHNDRPLTAAMREGLDCVDCGAVAPSVMKPVGRVYAPGDRQGWQVFSCCRDTAVSANSGERLTAYGKLGAYTGAATDYRSPALVAVRFEHANGALWTITRNDGHELSVTDGAYLNSIDYLTDECEHSWLIEGTRTLTHMYVVIID